MSRSSPNGDPERDEGPEDKTADDLFEELAEEESGLGTSADGDEIYDELADESPEEIIAGADEDVEHHPVDDAILPDEEALTELLLSERREEDGFLWVDTGGDGGDAEDDDPFDEDVVEDWSDAFAAASADAPETEVAPDSDDETDAPADGDAAPSISIEVPDPDDVDGARPDADDASEGGPEADPEQEPEPGSDVDDEPEPDATATADAADSSDDLGPKWDPETTDDDAATDEAASETERETVDESDDRIFGADPDDGALASALGEGGGNDGDADDVDDGDDADEGTSSGLLAKLRSLVPF